MTFTDLIWALILTQIALGALDTFYHHELTERLAWRPSQQRELKLHAGRNWLYTVLFAGIAWTMPHGWWAILAGGLFAIEVVLTTLDFVEEDRSRKLPASERVLHLILTLCFGGMLALLAPILWNWAAQPSALHAVNHCILSWVLTVGSLGTLLLGLREWLAANRCRRLATLSPAALSLGLPPNQTILVTGATGFIGTRLVQALTANGTQVIALVRDPGRLPAVEGALTVVTNLEQVPASARIDGIINLAGEPIAAGLWTQRRKAAILASRIGTTRDIAALIKRLDHRPQVLINGSATGWYGIRGDAVLDETSAPAPCFSHTLCAAWEAEADKVAALGVRVVKLRIGLVLGIEGGVLSRLLIPFELGLGGPIGSGRQGMPWITRDDLIRMMAFALTTPSFDGPLNAVAPNPVDNQAFVTALGRSLRRPVWLRLPGGLIRRAGGAMAEELLLGGQNVRPVKALAHGFAFNAPILQPALEAMTGAPANPALRRTLPLLVLTAVTQKNLPNAATKT